MEVSYSTLVEASAAWALSDGGEDGGIPAQARIYSGDPSSLVGAKECARVAEDDVKGLDLGAKNGNEADDGSGLYFNRVAMFNKSMVRYPKC
jgi:hypothetical protein